MKEFILCAAIHFNDGKAHEGQPKNIESGFVVTGRRHHNCYATLKAIADSIGLQERIRLIIEKADRDHQGFITSTDRFVLRPEAFKIAKENNQIYHALHDKCEDGILISEDLY
ncbi:MAG TPA: hypothetical protein VD794_02195 [Flavisolibacter sp.]|nr:hypothetical protein [Flavisolibacter sp.]